MGEVAWIPHDGTGCPVKMGTLVTIRYDNGEVEGPYPALTRGMDEHDHLDGWSWAHPAFDRVKYTFITAYRIHDDQAECDRISARAELFRTWIDGVTPKFPDNAPARKKERAQ